MDWYYSLSSISAASAQVSGHVLGDGVCSSFLAASHPIIFNFIDQTN